MNFAIHSLSANIFAKHLVLAIGAAAAALTLSGCAVPTSHRFAVYSLNQAGQFGSLDLARGKFTQIGPDLPEGETGLVAGPNGTLLTLGFSGNLYSIQLSSGVATIVGATGLADCSGPDSPCGPFSANNLGIVGSTIYANDFGNNLYTVDPGTGKATLIGNTGIPPALDNVDTINPDGTFNFFDSTLFSANGKLYETSSSSIVNFTNNTSVAVEPAFLYEINTTTGKATRIAPTSLNLTAAFNVDGIIYGYYGLASQFVVLSLTDGKTTKVSDDADPSVGITTGGYAVPVR
jgi:hypothetical protein